MSLKNQIYGIKACVFDAYGTLFDVYSAVGKYRGFKLAILSNGTPDMLDSAVKNSGIADLIDMNLSIEDIKIFFGQDTCIYTQKWN
jgi:FMN phosphatase YigB (HAD superfamily)